VAKEGEYALLKLPSGETRKCWRNAWRPLASSNTIMRMYPSQGGTQPWKGIARQPRVTMNPWTTRTRWRGQNLGRPSSGYPGASNQRLQDAQQQATDAFIVSRRVK